MWQRQPQPGSGEQPEYAEHVSGAGSGEQPEHFSPTMPGSSAQWSMPAGLTTPAERQAEALRRLRAITTPKTAQDPPQDGASAEGRSVSTTPCFPAAPPQKAAFVNLSLIHI